MTCYSAYDGVAITGSPYYMTDILRGELGFKGYVYSDWDRWTALKPFMLSRPKPMRPDAWHWKPG